MWELDCHDWMTLQAFRDPKDVPLALDRLVRSNSEEEWTRALVLLETYASDLGLPSESTKDVVACLVAIVIRTDGTKRSAILATLEELTCGRGIEEYNQEQLSWLRAAVRELAYALHTWAQLAESAPIADAILCLDLLAYCATFVPEVEMKVMRYFRLCAGQRPELGEELSALLADFNEAKQLLGEVDKS
jgi:hypothetical protein